MVSSKADGRKNPIGLFVLFLAYGWSKIECEVRICKLTGIPLFHLDMMYWNSDRTTVDKAVLMNF